MGEREDYETARDDVLYLVPTARLHVSVANSGFRIYSIVRAGDRTRDFGAGFTPLEAWQDAARRRKPNVMPPLTYAAAPPKGDQR